MAPGQEAVFFGGKAGILLNFTWLVGYIRDLGEVFFP